MGKSGNGLTSHRKGEWAWLSMTCACSRCFFNGGDGLNQHQFPHRDFMDATGITNFLVAEKYYSKKNRVFRVLCDVQENQPGKQVVVKQCLQSDQDCLREMRNLEILHIHGAAVPSLYRNAHGLLVMEHIPGPTLLELMETAESDDRNGNFQRYQVRKRMVVELMDWLDQAYTILEHAYGTPMILGDIHFRNFIAGSRLTGVDFESCRPGCIEEDIAELLAYLLHYNPAWTLWKRDLADCFRKEAMNRFDLKQERLACCFETKISEIFSRRHKQNYMNDLG